MTPTTLEVCIDCLMLLANGEVQDGSGNDITEQHAAKMRAVWGDTEITLGRISVPRYVVIENTPGYLPEDDDPFVTEDYASAVEYLNERAKEYEDGGVGGVEDYEVTYGLASSGNYAAVFVTDKSREHDLGRWIAIELDEDGDDEPFFSWSQCDGCHSNLGGDRGYATAWTTANDMSVDSSPADGFGMGPLTFDEAAQIAAPLVREERPYHPDDDSHEYMSVADASDMESDCRAYERADMEDN